MKAPVTSLKTYLFVEIALLSLLALTILVAQINLGIWNNLISLVIAGVKALLVILFFMRVRTSSKTIWVYAIAGFFWLVLMFGPTISDYLTRHWFP